MGPNPRKPETPTWLQRLIGTRTFALGILVSLVLAASIAAWLRIRLEVLPREQVEPFLFLRVASPEALSPEKVELALTMPVEGTLRTLPGVRKYSSNTFDSGASFLVTYRAGTNMELAVANLRETLQGLEELRVLDNRRTSISRFNPETAAVIKLSITHEGNLTDLSRTVTEDLRAGLESIPEVSKAELTGADPPLFLFSLTSRRLKEFGLTSQGVHAMLRFPNLRESLGSAPLGSGTASTSVRAVLTTNDLAEIRGQAISPGGAISLRDVADERTLIKAEEEISRKNGENAVFVEIFAKDSANLFSLHRHLDDYLKGLAGVPGDLSHLRFETIMNRTDDLQQALDDVSDSLYQAIAITFLVVLAFVRKARTTLLIAVTIPVTLLVTVLILYAHGLSLNILTLSGLTLGIGMVVDNAILVVGRIAELRNAGQPRKEAAGKGASDVMLAQLMGTVTNAVIFLPVAFLEGGDSFTTLLKAFQMPILATLAASLFVALVFLPAVTLLMRRNFTMGESSTTGWTWAIALFRRIQRYKYPLAAAMLGLVVWLASAVTHLPQTDLETPRDPFTTIFVRFSPEVPPERRKARFEALEDALLGKKATLGYRFLVSDFDPRTSNGNITLFPPRSADMDKALAALDRHAQAFLDGWTARPGMLASLEWIGSASGSGGRRRVFALSGPRMSQLLVIQDELKRKLDPIRGVERVALEREAFGKEELLFVPYDSVLKRFNLTLDAIAREILLSSASVNVGPLNLDGRAVGVRIRLLPPGNELTLESVKAMRIPVGEGASVDLATLGRFVLDHQLTGIERRQGLSTARFAVHFDDALSGGQYAAALAEVTRVVETHGYPRGYGIPQSASAVRIEEMRSKGDFMIYLSALLIYLILGAMFGSVLIPLAVLVTIPLAVIFGMAGLYFTGMDLDVMARLSLVILVGIGVNSAIILIDLIRSLQRSGYQRGDAIVRGCAFRLQAVLMTTSIQVIGVIPVALGKAKIMGIPYASLGISVISGMFFSTIVTLVVLPLMYELLDRAESRIKRRLGFG